ncbi:MAG: DedA family protein [Candidatus Pelagibacter sp. TMED118]|nr:MAG: DedA family protein [Candidatus Pelagibacter sp. TMED118]
MFKELYSKTIKLAGHKSSKLILGIVSFIESFIFPIPPDVLIIPMTLSKKKDWLKIATIACVGSVFGAILGYLIGLVFFNEIGIKIFELYGVDNTSFLKEKVSSEGGELAWIALLAIAGFTPVPFKLLTITSGFVGFNIFYFIIVATLTRGTRFFLISFLIGKFGPAMGKLLKERMFKVSIIFTLVILVVAYLIYKFLEGFIIL